MGRNLCEISCGQFPWKLKDENRRKVHQYFAAFFISLLEIYGQKFHPNFALGSYGHNFFSWRAFRPRKKYLCPPPPKNIPCRHPPGPSPCWENPPPLLGLSIRNRPPLSPPTPPARPERNKIYPKRPPSSDFPEIQFRTSPFPVNPYPLN